MNHTPENEDAAHGLQPGPAETHAGTSVTEAVSRRTFTDWVWFWVLTGLWSISFPLTRLAVQMTEPEKGLPVEVVVSGRMTIGAIVLLVATFMAGHRFPPLNDYRRWGVMALLGLIGMTLPFWLFTFAQKSIDSSLAALYTATAPLFVAVMAHFAFQDEKITRQKLAGLLIGFLGIGLLFGPDAISNFGSAGVLAQFFCLLAVTGYALETVMARGAPPMSPLVLATGFVCFGAVYSWFGLLNVDWSGRSPELSSWLAVVGLGIGPTALSALFYMALVRRTNATFLALTGYTIPVVSALIGFLAYGEVQPWHGFVAFGLILLGVWVSQPTIRKQKRPG